MADKTVEEIESEWKALKARVDRNESNRTKLQTHLDMKKKELKDLIASCKAMGVDPEKIQDEVRRAKEVLSTKMDVLAADLKASEDMIAPLLREME